MEEQDYPFKEECYEIIGACMAVHNELGCGFLESVYQEALSIEFHENNIPFECEKILSVKYKGYLLNKKFVADFLCYSEVIVELKAVEEFATEHIIQVLNYLKASKRRIGLLINFGAPKLHYKRVIL
jgi:GxxExxY protein